MTLLSFRSAFANYPHVLALKDGRAASPRLRFSFEETDQITRAFRRLVRGERFDLCEIALTTLAQARHYGKPFTALPIVVMRGFHHGALVCRADSPLRVPEDLAGKRVGVRAYSVTTGVWVRGILQNEYGVDPASITWVTSEDAHVQEYADPPNVERAPAGKTLSQMLLDREIDAGIALTGLDPVVIRTVIPDADAAAAAWYRKTGAYPVNHVICVQSDLLQQHDWLAAELMALFTAAKQAATTPSAEARWGAIVGADPLPYGLAANHAGIALGLRYAAQQGLLPDVYRPEDLFVTA
jgi:4,5-dihydroxyphthalate decarboxylase